MIDGALNRLASLRDTHPLAAEPLAAPREAGSERARRWGALEWFIIAQTVMPAVMYLPGTQRLRVLIRAAPFALSLVGVFCLLGSGAQLQGDVAVPLLSALTHDLTAIKLQNRDRDVRAVFSEDARHTQFLGDHARTHVGSRLFLS